jgi:hypothetical protein
MESSPNHEQQMIFSSIHGSLIVKGLTTVDLRLRHLLLQYIWSHTLSINHSIFFLFYVIIEINIIIVFLLSIL